MCIHLHLSVCVCITRGRRLHEGGGVVGNRSILQMLQGRSEWKVLWLSVVQQHSKICTKRHATCGPILLQCSFRSADWVIIEMLVGTKWLRCRKGEGKDQRGGREEGKKEEKHVYLWRLGLTSQCKVSLLECLPERRQLRFPLGSPRRNMRNAHLSLCLSLSHSLTFPCLYSL